MKILKYGDAAMPESAKGVLFGIVQQNCLDISDCFPYPSEDSEPSAKLRGAGPATATAAARGAAAEGGIAAGANTVPATAPVAGGDNEDEDDDDDGTDGLDVALGGNDDDADGACVSAAAPLPAALH